MSETNPTQTPETSKVPNPKVIFGIIALLILGVVLAIVVVVKNNKDNKKEEVAALQEEKLTPEDEVRLQAQIVPIVNAGDIKGCDTVTSPMYKNVCVNNIALNKANTELDISYCNYLDNILVSKDICIRKIILEKSIEKESMRVCNETSDISIQQQCKDNFFFALAVKKKDPKVCDQDTNKTKADMCWDAYHIQSTIITSPVTLDCSLLRENNVIADCKALSSSLTTKNIKVVETTCKKITTKAFLGFCSKIHDPQLQGAVFR